MIYLSQVKKQIAERMFGLDPVIDLLLVALTMEGHVLLEGNPGLGKTELVKVLTQSLGFEFTGEKSRWRRIQFTPDLMPADITGTEMPDGSGTLKFREGPIFCSFLLADEINRSPPKTQAAMLESMAEKQVTVLGKPRSLRIPVRSADRPNDKDLVYPFMVIATQNPIEHEGTYELPEAQLDRFMFKIRMPFPNRDNLDLIVDKVKNSEGNRAAQVADGTANAVKAAQDLADVSDNARRRDIDALVKEHILNIVLTSNGQLQGHEEAAAGVQQGLGPRAAIFLDRAIRGYRVLYPDATDVQALASVLLPVLRHRLRMKMEDFESFSASAEVQADTLDEQIRDFAKAAAPDTGNYGREFVDALLKAPS